MSRTLAIGDVHGCRQSLAAMEEFAAFTATDRIILLGDYVDRGPDTKGVLAWLVDRSPLLDLVCLRGNHDLVMLDARNGEQKFRTWMDYGGDAVLASYGTAGHAATLEDIPDEHWRLLDEELQPFYETEEHIFVHATPVADRPMSAQTHHDLYWSKFPHWQGPHCSGKTLICGHTSQKDGQIARLPGALCIDTWACGNGWLTCLDVHTGHYWQTNEQGQRQESKLTMPTL